MGIFDDENLIRQDCVVAEGVLARNFTLLKPAPGFEPLAVLIDKRYENNRHVKDRAGEFNDMLEGRVNAGIKDAQLNKTTQSRRFIGRDWVGFFSIVSVAWNDQN